MVKLAPTFITALIGYIDQHHATQPDGSSAGFVQQPGILCRLELAKARGDYRPWPDGRHLIESRRSTVSRPALLTTTAGRGQTLTFAPDS
jgi:hypothetical protein